MPARQRVVIIGGGFGGLKAAQALAREPVDVTLIDRRNFHLFQPLLYQVATGGLSPANIAAPLRAILKSRDNTQVLLAEVKHIDTARREVILREETLPYDILVVATGSTHSYFGHPEWEQWAPSLKTIEDATEIRRRILSAFEAAEREPDPARQQALLTFVIVGGGPTGVELAGAVAELARWTLRQNFRHFDPASAKIILVEGADRVLTTYAPSLSAKAARSLENLGVTVRTGGMVTNVAEHAVTVRFGNDEQSFAARTVLWAAGVTASPLGKIVADGTGAKVDRGGRLIVEPDLSLAGHPEIFVIGDLANFSHQTGEPLPGLAPVAMQQGTYIAKALRRRAAGKAVKPFRYFDRGVMATIGRAKAVADVRGVRFSGLLAWLGWLFIHLMFIIQFQSRVLILIQWAWNYTTRNAPARLITGREPFTLVGREESPPEK
ncbi:MAG TPA: NAD(P)/FAD-dependent oxidoreductase [Pirellulales bacterium]|nr:NAD(P)/FAD-dependent oxidoreductase [Pirellulales bacterium]